MWCLFFKQDVLGRLKIISKCENVLITMVGIDFSFKTFIEIYIYLEVFVDKKKIGFFELRQNDLSMVVYEAQFERLLKYVLKR